MLQAHVAGGTGGTGSEALLLPLEDGAVGSGNLVVILGGAGVEVHIVDRPAVIPVLTGLGEGHLAGGEPGIGQGDGLGLLQANVAGGGGSHNRGSSTGGSGGAGLVIENNGPGSAVPIHIHTQQLANVPDGQIGGAIISDNALVQSLSLAVEGEADVGAQLGGNLLAGGCRAGYHAAGSNGAHQGEGGCVLFPITVLHK